MPDQPHTPSGSRWEPDPDHHATAEAPVTPADEAPPALDDADAPAAYDATPEERRDRLRHRTALAGAAAALALGGGVTGFAIGHSTATDRHDGFSPANFSGQVPGNGQSGEGQQVPPGFGHDWDHDGGGGRGGDGGQLGQQQAPGTSGSSGSSSSSNSSGASTTASSASAT